MSECQEITHTHTDTQNPLDQSKLSPNWNTLTVLPSCTFQALTDHIFIDSWWSREMGRALSIRVNSNSSTELINKQCGKLWKKKYTKILKMNVAVVLECTQCVWNSAFRFASVITFKPPETGLIPEQYQETAMTANKQQPRDSVL